MEIIHRCDVHPGYQGALYFHMLHYISRLAPDRRFADIVFTTVFTDSLSCHASPDNGLQEGNQGDKVSTSVRDHDYLRNLNIGKSMRPDEMHPES